MLNIFLCNITLAAVISESALICALFAVLKSVWFIGNIYYDNYPVAATQVLLIALTIFYTVLLWFYIKQGRRTIRK